MWPFMFGNSSFVSFAVFPYRSIIIEQTAGYLCDESLGLQNKERWKIKLFPRVQEDVIKYLRLTNTPKSKGNAYIQSYALHFCLKNYLNDELIIKIVTD